MISRILMGACAAIICSWAACIWRTRRNFRVTTIMTQRERFGILCDLAGNWVQIGRGFPRRLEEKSHADKLDESDRARLAAPGGTPRCRLKARLNAASDS